MKVRELIMRLGVMPPDAEVMLLYDGALRGNCDSVWLTRNGETVGLGDESEPIYSDASRTLNAPSAGDDPYWRAK